MSYKSRIINRGDTRFSPYDSALQSYGLGPVKVIPVVPPARFSSNTDCSFTVRHTTYCCPRAATVSLLMLMLFSLAQSCAAGFVYYSGTNMLFHPFLSALSNVWMDVCLEGADPTSRCGIGSSSDLHTNQQTFSFPITSLACCTSAAISPGGPAGLKEAQHLHSMSGGAPRLDGNYLRMGK